MFWGGLMVGGVLAVSTGLTAIAARSVLPDDPSLAAAPAPLLLGGPLLFLAGVFGWLAEGRAVRPAIAFAFVALVAFNLSMTIASVEATDQAWAIHLGLLLGNVVIAAIPCAWLWMSSYQS